MDFIDYIEQEGWEVTETKNFISGAPRYWPYAFENKKLNMVIFTLYTEIEGVLLLKLDKVNIETKKLMAYYQTKTHLGEITQLIVDVVCCMKKPHCRKLVGRSFREIQ